MASRTILFLRETRAPMYYRPVSVVHHPDFPAPRYEVLYRLGNIGKPVLEVRWFGRKADALRFAKYAHTASDGDIERFDG